MFRSILLTRIYFCPSPQSDKLTQILFSSCFGGLFLVHLDSSIKQAANPKYVSHGKPETNVRQNVSFQSFNSEKGFFMIITFQPGMV